MFSRQILGLCCMSLAWTACEQVPTATDFSNSSLITTTKLFAKGATFVADGSTAQYKDSLSVPNTSLIGQPKAPHQIKLKLDAGKDSSGLARFYLDGQETCTGTWKLSQNKLDLTLNPMANNANQVYCVGNPGPFSIKINEKYMAIDAMALVSDPGWIFFERSAE